MENNTLIMSEMIRSWVNVIDHYIDIIMSVMASQITSLTIVYSTVYSGAVQRKHQSSASMAFVRGIHRWPVNSPHKGSVMRKKFPFDDFIMELSHDKLQILPRLYMYNFSTQKEHGQINSFHMENKDLPILHSQYRDCWWPGNARSQHISSHATHLVWGSVI